MGARTTIEWTRSSDGAPGATWNPLVGCTSVSPGCDNCYARTQVDTRFHPAALALGGKHLEAFPATFDTVSLRPDRFLTQPLRWREPKRIFVNSLSDLFHDDVPAVFIARVFAVMALAQQHTFQLLTKRHGRMRSLLASRRFLDVVDEEREQLRPGCGDFTWPLPNVWLGVSVENQQWADIRIPALLNTPAAVRFLSCEPLLGPVMLPLSWLHRPGHDSRINWVIAGGESGRGARPMHPDWTRTLRDQCVFTGTPFLFKQWGEWAPLDACLPRTGTPDVIADPDGHIETRRTTIGTRDQLLFRVGKKAAGRVLDGRTWDEYPAVAR